MSRPEGWFGTILYETSPDDGVATITLNRPEVHNALDRALSAELNRAVREIRDDRDCRVVVLRGAGDTFCAGDDITEFNTWTPDDPYWQVRKYQETVQMIEDLTPITIAAVDGVCTGGGLELTLVCDFVVATANAALGMAGPPLVEAALGERLTPEQIGAVGLHAAAGAAEAGAADQAQLDDELAVEAEVLRVALDRRSAKPKSKK